MTFGNIKTLCCTRVLVRFAIAALALACFGPSANAQLWPNQGGVWRFHGLAGKCLDVGGYPLGHSSPVILYDCNGTTAQDITAVPHGIQGAGLYYELRAHTRCLTIGQPEMQNTERLLISSTIFRSYLPGMPIVLSPCDGSDSQH